MKIQSQLVFLLSLFLLGGLIVLNINRSLLGRFFSGRLGSGRIGSVLLRFYSGHLSLRSAGCFIVCHGNIQGSGHLKSLTKHLFLVLFFVFILFITIPLNDRISCCSCLRRRLLSCTSVGSTGRSSSNGIG